jgi:protein involved in polysaccharide export with SLBB domain
MNFNCTWLTRGLTVCGLTLAAILSNGCASSDTAIFSDAPTPPPMAAAVAPTGSPSAGQTDANGEFAKFHVGDTVTVALSGLPNPIEPVTTTITDDGTIALSDIGKVQAAGKTAGELQNEIHDMYVPAYYTHITVTVTIGDRVYYVRGEVKTPGRLVYTSETTVTKAIAAAGDFTDFANRRKVKLMRANGSTATVNCNRVLSGDEPDPQVYPGDQIYVPKTIW